LRLKDWDDAQSWIDFYETYRRLIFGVALKAGLTEVEASDALQETVMTVAREIREFKYDPARGSFKGWLLQRTRWRIGDQFRKRQWRLHQRLQETGKTDLIERVPDPASLEISESLWDEEWCRNLLAVAAERVKAKVEPRTWQIYQLYVQQEWPMAKVAKSLGISSTLVYVVKHRIEGMLRRELRVLARKAAQPPAQP
jgi:RNA polymerase sigma-70 factor (ECF subfamily)